MGRLTKKQLLATVLLSLLAMTATVTAAVRSRTVPLSQCHGVYLRFKDTPGVDAAFIKHKYINDSISLDLTILVAQDSSSMAALLRGLGKTDSSIHCMMTTWMSTDNGRFTSLYRNDSTLLAEGVSADLLAVYPIRKTVVLYSVEQEWQLDWLIFRNINETLNIPIVPRDR